MNLANLDHELAHLHDTLRAFFDLAGPSNTPAWLSALLDIDERLQAALQAAQAVSHANGPVTP